MKKTALLLLTVILCACVLAACVNNYTPEEPEAPQYEAKFDNLDDYVCDVSAASSVGIMKNRVEEQQTTATKNDSFWARLFGTQTASAYEATYVNSFVMQTENGGIENVTFRRIVTENAQTTVEGERTIRPKKDGGYKYIEFDAQEGLTYTITDDQGRVITENFVDNCQADLNPTVGYAKVEVGNMGHCYIVRYSGPGTEEIITQEDMDCEVEKCYTTGDFTFVCFVPKGFSRRQQWIDEVMASIGLSSRTDNKGVYEFDKTDYDSFGEEGYKYYLGIEENGEFYCEYDGGGQSGIPKQCYVIDNNSGCIYKLDFDITRVNEGLVSMNGIVYDMRVGEDNTLEFVPITKNTTIGIGKTQFFKDKYGNAYVQNSQFNALDEENKVMYYTGDKYILATDGTALTIDWGYEWPHRPSSVKKMDADFAAQKIEKEDSFTVNTIAGEDFSFLIHKIENGCMKYYHSSGSTNLAVYKADIYTMATEQRELASWDGSLETRIMAVPYAHGDTYGVIILTELTGESAIYYCPDLWTDEVVWSGRHDEETQRDIYTINENVCIKFDSNVSFPNLSYDDDWSRITYNKVTIDSNDSYRIALDKNGIPYSLLESAYTASEAESITLQPINR